VTSLHTLPINVVLTPCCLPPSLLVLSVLASIETAAVETVVDSVLSSEQTIAKYSTGLDSLMVESETQLTNYNCFNGSSPCSISCTYHWKNGTHINIWGWTDGEVSLMMSGCLTSTHQSNEEEVGHSTYAYNTHLYIEGIH